MGLSKYFKIKLALSSLIPGKIKLLFVLFGHFARKQGEFTRSTSRSLHVQLQLLIPPSQPWLLLLFEEWKASFSSFITSVLVSITKSDLFTKYLNGTGAFGIFFPIIVNKELKSCAIFISSNFTFQSVLSSLSIILIKFLITFHYNNFAQISVLYSK